MPTQDAIAYLIVAVAAGAALRSVYRKYVVGPLSTYFLKNGKVALAMRIRGKAKSAKDCGGDCCD